MLERVVREVDMADETEQPSGEHLTLHKVGAHLAEAFDADAHPGVYDVEKRGLPTRLARFDDPTQEHPKVIDLVDPREPKVTYWRRRLLAPLVPLNPAVASFMSACMDKESAEDRGLTEEELGRIALTYGWSMDYAQRLRSAARRVMLAAFSSAGPSPADVRYVQVAGGRSRRPDEQSPEEMPTVVPTES